MSKIEVLDQQTIDKIAAGEVIERPASVVKELVENAIDAGAGAVTVEIRDGGISFIRITDNGMGMEAEEVPLAFLRHATSKIRKVEDLLGVTSLGFRGEALSSIAAVCQVELITKTEENLTGTRYIIEGGKEKSLEEIGAPSGTTFLVRNIFYNTPARKKFLKTPQTEAGYISDMLERIALSHPEVSFKFMVNNQTKLHTSGNHNLKDIIYNVYGRDIAANLIEVSAVSEEAKLTGFIGKPVISRGNRNYENYFVNGRYIKSSVISRAIEDAYDTFMMKHKYPFTALHLTIDGELLDINVHPTKMELRFADNEKMYRFIYDAVRSALSHREMIPRVSAGREEKKSEKKPVIKTPFPEPFEKQRIAHMGQAPGNPYVVRETGGQLRTATREGNDGWQTSLPQQADIKKRQPSSGSDYPQVREITGMSAVREENAYEHNQTASAEAAHEKEVPVKEAPVKEALAKEEAAKDAPEKETAPEKNEQLNLFDEKLLSKENVREHKIIGQVFDTYWLVQFRDDLFIIDQHAAHEKVLYERTMKSLKEREFTSQILNPPVILTLSMQEEALLIKYMDHFTQIGFEIEAFGGREYALRAVPDNLFGIEKEDLFIEMLDDLSGQAEKIRAESINDRIASMSCKAAVKGNHRLSIAEVHALIDELLTLENPYNCPHGRPTIVAMSKYDLERKFKRIV